MRRRSHQPATLRRIQSQARLPSPGDLHANPQRRSQRLPQRGRHASRDSSLLRRIRSSSNLLAFLVLDSCLASVASLVPRRPSLVNAPMASASFSCSQIQSIGVNVTEQGANEDRQPWRFAGLQFHYTLFSLFVPSSKIYRTGTLPPLYPAGLPSFFSMRYS